MKREWISSILLTLVCLILINGIYTAVVWGIAQITPQKGLAERIKAPNGQLYYINVAQKFTEDKYFWARPSAVDYNAAGSGGSNKAPSNLDYLKTVNERLDTFLVHNPDLKKADIPTEMVTASGSGLDPDISPASAYIQIPRVSKFTGIDKNILRRIINQNIDSSFTGIAPVKINVLKLNLALANVQQHLNG